jgi:hypothetical protein
VKRSKRAVQLIEKWRPRLLLGEWRINVSYPSKDVETHGPGECLADVVVNPVYFLATINIYPAWFNKTQDVQEHAIVHELCHCFTQEAWNLMDSQHNGVVVHPHTQRDAIERLTQRIANAVAWGRK